MTIFSFVPFSTFFGPLKNRSLPCASILIFAVFPPPALSAFGAAVLIDATPPAPTATTAVATAAARNFVSFIFLPPFR